MGEVVDRHPRPLPDYANHGSFVMLSKPSLLVVGLIILLITLIPAKAQGSQLPHDDLGEQSSAIEPNPLVQEMITQVKPEDIYQLTGDLSGEWPVTIGGEPYTITTRNTYSGEPIRKAAEYLYAYYQDLGLEVAYQDFTFAGLSLANVVAEKEGSVFPERVYLITSHYDDAPKSGVAPGADDNASGTVGVMLAASILSQYNFGCTLRFVNFSAEEQGLFGSAYYAQQSYFTEADLRGVLNLDMIAFNTPNSPTEMELHANQSIPGSAEIAYLFQDIVATYELNLTTEITLSGISASDHASFWDYDYPAILAIEDLDDFNPRYHSRYDRLICLEDRDYYTEMVKASLATLAHMGCLVEEDKYPPAFGQGIASQAIESVGIPGREMIHTLQALRRANESDFYLPLVGQGLFLPPPQCP